MIEDINEATSPMTFTTPQMVFDDDLEAAAYVLAEGHERGGGTDVVTDDLTIASAAASSLLQGIVSIPSTQRHL
jgi:hypothetical protein